MFGNERTCIPLRAVWASLVFLDSSANWRGNKHFSLHTDSSHLTQQNMNDHFLMSLLLPLMIQRSSDIWRNINQPKIATHFKVIVMTILTEEEYLVILLL